MGQIVIKSQKPKYCNLVAVTTGSKKDYILSSSEIWLVDTTNSSKTNGSGKYDKYIIGDDSHTASYLATNALMNIDDVQQIKIDSTPTSGSDNAVSSGGVYQAIQNIDISGKVDASNAIDSLSLSMNSSTYVITLSGTKVDGTTFTVSDPIDIPLESVVVDGEYNSTTKKVILTLKSGSTVEFSIVDLINGLQSEITSTNKLSADLISDGTTNKTVTQSEKNSWDNKLDSFTETDPIFSASAAATIKSTDITNWNSKTSNVGTITGITMNGILKGTSGVVDLGTVIQDISDKANSIDVYTKAQVNDMLNNCMFIGDIVGNT